MMTFWVNIDDLFLVYEGDWSTEWTLRMVTAVAEKLEVKQRGRIGICDENEASNDAQKCRTQRGGSVDSHYVFRERIRC